MSIHTWDELQAVLTEEEKRELAAVPTEGFRLNYKTVNDGGWYLGSLMDWKHTPQGAAYWASVDDRINSL